MRRWALGMAALAASVLAGCGGGSVGAVLKRPTVYRDPGSWQVLLPRGWDHQHIAYEPRASGEGISWFNFADFALSNSDLHRFPHSQIIFGAGRSFPADGVAFSIDAPELPGPAAADSRIPVKVSDFTAVKPLLRSPAPGRDRPRTLTREIVGDGAPWTAYAVIGSRASTSARRQLSQVIASLRFSVARRGVNANGAFGLGAPRDYRTGSFTLITARDEPSFFVVHAPGATQIPACRPRSSCVRQGAFYAVYCNVGENLGPCRIHVDVHRDRFDGPSGEQWNRIGQALDARAPANHPLPTRLLTISWDGRLVLPFLTFGQDVDRAAWPGWR